MTHEFINYPTERIIDNLITYMFIYNYLAYSQFHDYY